MWLRAFLLLSAAGSAPAMAQDVPKASRPTVEQYLCTFAGKCDGAEMPVETRDAPPTKGFRLARSNSNAAAKAPERRANAYVPARRPAMRSAAASRSDRGASYAPAASVARSRASGGPRADLMIGFELNSARLTRDGAQAAQVFAQSLLRPELKAMRFRIEGHTDISGGRQINGPLSSARAQAVADYLVSLGVDRSRLVARGFGADQPLDGHRASDPDNRRVEAELIS